MAHDAPPLECVAFILVQAGKILVEKRSLTKRVVPGATAIPGGHLEAGEQPEDALRRELHEELGIVATRHHYVCTLLHRAEEFRKLHYFAVEAWDGALQAHEADALVWLGFDQLAGLSLDVDRVAIHEYIRLRRV